MTVTRCWVILVVCAALFSAPVAAETCAPGPNLADTDGDGLFDHACVGDWNRNGTCEMQEIQTAILNLLDPGPKTVVLNGCEFAPPTAAFNSHGIIALPSNTTLTGSGPETLLHGFAETDVQSPQAVITNSDHLGGSSNVVISDLRIDGGWRAGDPGDLGHARMGIRFTTCTDCRVERVEVTDTLHACLYASNSVGIELLDSTLKRCGNYGGTGMYFPCVYLYAFEGSETRDVLVSGIDCDGSGASAFSTRRDAPASTLNNLTFQNNTGRNTSLYPNGAHRPCFMLSGIGSAQYLNNSCVDTGGLANLSTESYYSEGLEVNASANITVDGLHVVSSTVTSPVDLRKYAENFTLRNITVEAVTNTHCMAFETPLRNFSLDGAEFSGCGESGIYHRNTESAGLTEDERLTFRNIAIHEAGTGTPSAGIHFRAPMKGLLLENVSVNDATADGLHFDGTLEDSTLSDVSISNVAGSGIHVGGDTRNVNLTGTVVDGTGSDCIFLGGTPAPAVSHRQTAITGSTLGDCGDRGIAMAADDLSVHDFRINDNTIDGVDGDGIELALGDFGSANVDLMRNVLRNFGRSEDGDAYCGIELSGPLTGTMISQNLLHDQNDQATYGIYHDVPGSHPTYLCSNPCIGTLRPNECLHAVENPAYETDSDLDGTVDACEDDDADGVYGPDDNCADHSNPLQADADQDGVGDACDNCLDEPNTTQSDFDSDTIGDHCDLNDGLIYVLFPDPNSLSWQLEQGFYRWNVYRGDLTVLLAGGTYTQQPGSSPLASRACGLSVPQIIDEDPLVPDQVAFYLVTGGWGFRRSSLGADSDGVLRPNAFPCWP